MPGTASIESSAHLGDGERVVLLLHGYNARSTSTDCSRAFDDMVFRMRQAGVSGRMVKVGFYTGDRGCDVNLRSYGSFDERGSWKEIAGALSAYIHLEYTARGVTVDVVGHSMGGLIIRAAVLGAQIHEPGFSSPIDVRTVVTLGTPHDGAAWYSRLCRVGQCSSLRPSSPDIAWLHRDGRPQGIAGTEFTVIASRADRITPSPSGLHMDIPASHKITNCCVAHAGSSGYLHDEGTIALAVKALLARSGPPGRDLQPT
jgi:pimeloyl-ACP methyl ester carboxylesterase